VSAQVVTWMKSGGRERDVWVADGGEMVCGGQVFVYVPSGVACYGPLSSHFLLSCGGSLVESGSLGLHALGPFGYLVLEVLVPYLYVLVSA
jgi:hypothetical protein